MSSQRIRVLKFGSSVLATRRDVSRALHEIYAQLREGNRVVAVVSAVGQTTERLLASAQKFGKNPDLAALALLLSTGETQSVALLALALERAGISCSVLDPAQLGLRSCGDLLDAEPTHFDEAVLRNALAEKSVVVVPGFIGRDERGCTTLFGRGGSDLSALFLAQRLGASCRLVKDVAGVFDCDPAENGAAARRFEVLAWEDALSVGGGIVQEKALRFAREQRFEFEVGALGSTESTLVGRGPSRFAATRAAPRKLRVALLGLGTVGLGVYRELARFPDRFEVTSVLVRRSGLGRPPRIPSKLITTDADRANDCDILVEVLGGREPAGALIEAALSRGIDVVSANKGLIVERGAEFRALAQQNAARFLYSASVCGALPLLETVRNLASERRLVSIEGIFNSTTNVVLDLLAQGKDFAEALGQARRQGFCESDPSEDLDGTDAAHKLVLAAREGFGEAPSVRWTKREGILNLQPADVRSAALAGQVVRLVATCRRRDLGLELQLCPTHLHPDHPLARTVAEQNAVLIHTEDGARFVLRGRGAGRWPTTQAVVGDLLELSRLRAVEFVPTTLSAEIAAAS